MADLLLSLPVFVSMMLVAALSSLISVAVLRLIRKRLAWEHQKENHEVAGFLFNALGLIYAVIVAFVIFISWTEYKDALNHCEKEADHLRIVYRNSKAFDQETQNRIKESVARYAELVVNEEWPLLGDGIASDKAKSVLVELWNIHIKMNGLDSPAKQIVLQSSMDNLSQSAEARMMRIAVSKKHVPSAVWIVILTGALTSVGFSLFFGTRDFRIQASLTSLFAMTNAIIMLLIFLLDHPFSGSAGIRPGIFIELLEYIKRF